MKRIIVLYLLAICFPSESFCEGIFGLKKGMSTDEMDLTRLVDNSINPHHL